LAYVAQIARAIKDPSGAQAISFGTCVPRLARLRDREPEGLEDGFHVFLGALGCGAIVLIAAWKRSSRAQVQESLL